MRVRRHRMARLGVLAVVFLALVAVPARAADTPERPFEEPGITFLAYHDPYMEWLAGAVIIVACLIVAFKNPHRTHMD
jgi:hypothetical protein